MINPASFIRESVRAELVEAMRFDKLSANGIHCVPDQSSRGGFERFLTGFLALATKGAASCW
jgi:hypothetical protein